MFRTRRFQSPAIFGAASGGGGSPVLTFISSTNFGSRSGAVETYTNFSIGPTAGFTTRRIIGVIPTNNLNGATAISSILINGSIVPTIHVQTGLGSGAPFVAIFSADIPTGTTATFAITYNGTLFNDQPFATYSVDDALLSSTTPQTGSATASGVTTLATSAFNQSVGGFTIAIAALSGTATGLGFTGYSTDVFGGSSSILVSHLGSIGSSGSVTANATWTTSFNAAVAATSWR